MLRRQLAVERYRGAHDRNQRISVSGKANARDYSSTLAIEGRAEPAITGRYVKSVAVLSRFLRGQSSGQCGRVKG